MLLNRSEPTQEIARFIRLQCITRALEAEESMYETIFLRLKDFLSHVTCFIIQRAAGVRELTHFLRACSTYQAKDLLARIDKMFVATFESILKISL